MSCSKKWAELPRFASLKVLISLDPNEMQYVSCFHYHALHSDIQALWIEWEVTEVREGSFLLHMIKQDNNKWMHDQPKFSWLESRYYGRADRLGSTAWFKQPLMKVYPERLSLGNTHSIIDGIAGDSNLIMNAFCLFVVSFSPPKQTLLDKKREHDSSEEMSTSILMTGWWQGWLNDSNSSTNYCHTVCGRQSNLSFLVSVSAPSDRSDWQTRVIIAVNPN